MIDDATLDRIRRVCRHIGGQWFADLEDLFQSACLAVLEHLRDHPADAGDQDLMATIAYRRALSHLRRESRLAKRFEPGVEFLDVYPGGTADADARLDVRAAVAGLDERKRRFLARQVDDGLSVAEAAKEAGIAHATGQLWNHKIYNAIRPGLESGYGAAVDRRRTARPAKRRDHRNNRLVDRPRHPVPERD